MHGSNAPLLGRIITEEVNTDPLGRMTLMRRLYKYSLVDGGLDFDLKVARIKEGVAPEKVSIT